MKKIPNNDDVWVKKRFSFAHHAEEEKWLEEMAGKGLQLDWVSVTGYGFKKMQPARIHYMVDFLSQNGFTTEFEKAHREEGWEPVYRQWGRHYFRSSGNEAPERRHFNIPAFIRAEKWLLMPITAGILLLILGYIAYNVFLYFVEFTEWWEYLLIVLFLLFLILMVIHAGGFSRIRRISYVLGLKRAWKRGEVT